MSMYFIAYIFLIVLFRAAERTFLKGKRSALLTGGADWSYYTMVIPFMLSLILPPVEHMFFKQNPLAVQFWLGILLFLASLVIRCKGLADIREAFSVNIEKQEKHDLVTTGIYSNIRHPLYLGICLQSLSASIMLDARLSWLFVLMTFAGVVLRTAKEEKFLIEHFPGYRQYMKKSWRLIPWLY